MRHIKWCTLLLGLLLSFLLASISCASDKTNEPTLGVTGLIEYKRDGEPTIAGGLLPMPTKYFIVTNDYGYGYAGSYKGYWSDDIILDGNTIILSNPIKLWSTESLPEYNNYYRNEVTYISGNVMLPQGKWLILSLFDGKYYYPTIVQTYTRTRPPTANTVIVDYTRYHTDNFTLEGTRVFIHQAYTYRGTKGFEVAVTQDGIRYIKRSIGVFDGYEFLTNVVLNTYDSIHTKTDVRNR